MDIKQLITFLAIADYKNFTKAAESLNYAQSTVTTQIQNLEKEFNIRIFERLGHTIELTCSGKRLLPYAKEIIRLSNEAQKSLSDQRT